MVWCQGYTPLHYASYKGLDKVASVLLEHGASVHTQDMVSVEVPAVIAFVCGACMVGSSYDVRRSAR